MAESSPGSLFPDARSLFIAALALPPNERDQYLEANCPDSRRRRDIEDLLAHAVSKLDNDADPPRPIDAGPEASATRAPYGPPPEISGYEVVRFVNSGGMADVWIVRDVTFDRLLALKAIRPDYSRQPDKVSRFVVEAQVTGQLSHPGIVPVHTLSRLADGRHCYLMKLVEGRTLQAAIHSSADRQFPRLDLLPVFSQVCQTVAYAHSRGVIHRDLKPANVMLGEHGEVHVLDWGLVKRLDREGSEAAASHGVETPAAPLRARGDANDDAENGGNQPPSTEFGHVTVDGARMGTVLYMSPEQAEGRSFAADKRSDVFSLGAILCEILTGQPLGVSLDEAGRRLSRCPADPELIRIAMRCLSRQADERLADGQEAAAAIAAYLAAVRERADQQRLDGERRERQRQAGVAKKYLDFLTSDVFAAVDPDNASSRDVSLKEALDRAAEGLLRRALEQSAAARGLSSWDAAEAEVEIRAALGKLYFKLGEYERSRELFAGAAKLAEQGLGLKHPLRLTALDQLGQVCIRLEEFEAAEQTLQEAYQRQLEILGPDHEDTVHSFAKLGDLMFAMGRLDEAARLTRETLEIRRRLWGPNYPFVPISLNGMGRIALDRGDPQAARQLFIEAEDVSCRTHGPSNRVTVQFRHNRAVAAWKLGDCQAAIAALREVGQIRRDLLGPGHIETLETEVTLAQILIDVDDSAGALAHCDNCLTLLKSYPAATASFRGRVLAVRSLACLGTGRHAEAVHSLEEAKRIPEKPGRLGRLLNEAIAKAQTALINLREGD